MGTRDLPQAPPQLSPQEKEQGAHTASAPSSGESLEVTAFSPAEGELVALIALFLLLWRLPGKLQQQVPLLLGEPGSDFTWHRWAGGRGSVSRLCLQ